MEPQYVWIMIIAFTLLVLVLIAVIMEQNDRLNSICDDLRTVIQKQSLLTSKDDNRLILNAWSTSRKWRHGRLMKDGEL